VPLIPVAEPYKTKLIAEAHVKNDKVDAMVLARLLAANFICEVWVPLARVRQQRALAAHRARLQQQCNQIKNRLHSILHRHNLLCPENSLFSEAGRAWLRCQQLPEPDHLQARHLLSQLDLLEEQLEEADREVARWASQDPRVPRLMQITGIRYYTAFALLALIGNIQRFATPGKLAAYAGLVPCEDQSGDRHRRGSITKAGRPLLRWLMVEAARSAVRWHPHWQRIHHRIAQRRGTNVATVAVARKLLVTVWFLWTGETVNHHLRPQTFVTKLQHWVYRIGRAHLGVATSREFVQRHLKLLELDHLSRSLVTEGRNGRLRIQSA